VFSSVRRMPPWVDSLIESSHSSERGTGTLLTESTECLVESLVLVKTSEALRVLADDLGFAQRRDGFR
jgi:hypothetical protein